MKLRFESTKNSCRGAVLIETAICLPLMFIFLFGILEISHLQDFRQRASSALAEALRTAASVPGLSDSGDNGPALLTLKQKNDELLRKYNLVSEAGVDYVYTSANGGIVQATIVVEVPKTAVSGMFHIPQIKITGSTAYLFYSNSPT